jgi:signal transduction histidine kinase
MEKIVGLIEEGIEQTRTLARGLLLAEVERDGLVTALRALAATLATQHRVECSLGCEDEVSLEESGTATHIYRIAEEAARNAVRHGRASRVRFELSSGEEGLSLSVRDNGTGIPEVGRRGRGLGLRIMAHRAAIIGAQFSVDAHPDGGTTVNCRLPLPHKP